MKLVVGLGNPGPNYVGTRHNVGFDVIDQLRRAPHVGAVAKKFDAELSEAQESGTKVLYLKPLTFMNLSGRSVRQALDFYKIPVADLLVVTDDINLPLGQLRARSGGSPGGHNGLKDIERHLGSPTYSRLRLGVGGPDRQDLADYVLARFRPTERAAVEAMEALAMQAVLTWVREGIQVCMNQFNARRQGEA